MTDTTTRPAFPVGTIIGYPRIGRRRELKKAVESFWAGSIDEAELEATAASLRAATRERLAALGLGRDDAAIPETFSYYDQVLDAAVAVGAVPSRFADDERTCRSLCPNAQVTLYTYHNPGEDISQAVSINGQPYSQSPNAFRFRTQYDKTCSCRAPGQSWADALKNVDTSSGAEQGDITVTEDRAKRMSQPPRTAPAKHTATPPASAPATAAPEAKNDPGKIRSVGPTFILNNH